MGQIARALGQGADIEFDGTTYRISPWTYGIQGDFELYLQEQAIKTAKRIGRFLDEQERKEHMAKLNEDITSGVYSFGSEAVARAMQNVTHLEHLLWLMLKVKQPDIKKEIARKMVEVELDEVMRKMGEANEDPTPQPTPAS